MLRTPPEAARQALEILLTAHAAASNDVTEGVADTTALEILKHAMVHLVWPLWERQWTSAVK